MNTKTGGHNRMLCRQLMNHLRDITMMTSQEATKTGRYNRKLYRQLVSYYLCDVMKKDWFVMFSVIKILYSVRYFFFNSNQTIRTMIRTQRIGAGMMKTTLMTSMKTMHIMNKMLRTYWATMKKKTIYRCRTKSMKDVCIKDVFRTDDWRWNSFHNTFFLRLNSKKYVKKNMNLIVVTSE